MEMKFNELIEKWLKNHVKRKIGEVTEKDYKRTAAMFNEFLSDCSLCDIDKRMISNVVENIIELNFARTNKWMTSKTEERHLKTISSIFNYGVKKGYISENPLAEKAFREYSPKVNVVSNDVVMDFFREIQGNRIYNSARLSLLTGMRVGEIAGLRWQDIDMKNKTININWQRGHSKPKNTEYICISSKKNIWLVEPKKGSRRRIGISEKTVSFLKKIEKEQSNNKYGFVIINKLGYPYRKDSISNGFSNAVKASCLSHSKFTFHDLRHQFVSGMLSGNKVQAPITILAISKYIGHAKVEYTLKYYAHLINQRSESIPVATDNLFAFDEQD
jgi:integrase